MFDIEDGDFLLMPGFYLRWELCEVLRPGHVYMIEDGCTTTDGAQLVRIFRWEAHSKKEIAEGLTRP